MVTVSDSYLAERNLPDASSLMSCGSLVDLLYFVMCIQMEKRSWRFGKVESIKLIIKIW